MASSTHLCFYDDCCLAIGATLMSSVGLSFLPFSRVKIDCSMRRLMQQDWKFQHCLSVKISFYIMTGTIAVITIEPAGDAGNCNNCYSNDTFSPACPFFPGKPVSPTSPFTNSKEKKRTVNKLALVFHLSFLLLMIKLRHNMIKVLWIHERSANVPNC